MLEHERDVGVFQGLDAGGDGQADGDVVVVFDAVFAAEVEIAQLAGELNNVARVADLQKAGVAVGLFEHPRDVHVDDFLFFLGRKRLDEAIAA